MMSERTRKLQASMSSGTLPVGLPGMKNAGPNRGNHAKQQVWDIKGETRVETRSVNKTLGELGQQKEELLKQWHEIQEAEKIVAVSASQSELSKSKSSPLLTGLRKPPSWLKHSRQVLRFFMYFQEPVYESSGESFRVRKCVCFYYLEDGSIAIQEPKENNSGLMSGSFLKRGVIQKESGGALEGEDFLPGKEVTIHGRTFRCVDADKATRDHFKSLGVQVAPAEPYPEDDHRRKVREQEEADAAKRMSKVARSDSLGRFLKNDQTLKFSALWDDTRRLFGEKNFYTVCFFLSDETIEVRMSSRQSESVFPILLKRSRLPREDGEGHVTAADLRCGEYFNCWGRKLMLLDCCDFTRSYYERVHGMKQATVQIKEAPKTIIKKTIPPYNGFGSEADSLANCLNLIPKPVSQDLHRFLNNRGKTLKFKAKFVNPGPEDVERRFLITYFMDDDTVSVYEPPKRNSGIVGGKFLERGKYKKPIKEKARPNDDLKKLQTEILDKIQSHLVGGPYALLRAFRKFGTDEKGCITFQNFRVGLRGIGILENAFTDDQLERLFKAYDMTGDMTIDYQEFVDHVMQDKPIASNETRFSNRWLRGSDFYVGAIMQFLFPQTGAMTQEFVILSADKQTLDMMADNPAEFPKSNVEAIASMLAETLIENHVNVTDAFKIIDKEGKGWIYPEEFGLLLKDWAFNFGLVAEELTDHEMLTLVRHYDRDCDGRIYYHEFAAALHKKKPLAGYQEESQDSRSLTVEEATEAIFSKLQNLGVKNDVDLMAKFREIDENDTGKISWEEFQLMLRRYDIFLNNDRDKSYLMLRFDHNGDGLIDYTEFFNSLFDTEIVKEAGQMKKRLIPRSPKSLFEADTQAQYEADGRNMLDYNALLKVAQQKKSEQVLLKEMMMSFVSKFTGRRKFLDKVFASFDLDGTGKVNLREFTEALRRANPDYSRDDKLALISYLFSQPNTELAYQRFMDVFFSLDTSACISTFGKINAAGDESN